MGKVKIEIKRTKKYLFNNYNVMRPLDATNIPEIIDDQELCISNVEIETFKEIPDIFSTIDDTSELILLVGLNTLSFHQTTQEIVEDREYKELLINKFEEKIKKMINTDFQKQSEVRGKFLEKLQDFHIFEDTLCGQEEERKWEEYDIFVNINLSKSKVYLPFDWYYMMAKNEKIPESWCFSPSISLQNGEIYKINGYYFLASLEKVICGDNREEEYLLLEPICEAGKKELELRISERR